MDWRYVNGNPFESNHSDWRYRYNAMGEREQKRLYHAPLADSVAGSPYPWVQYILGGSKDQLAVWHGQQMTSLFCDTVKLRNVYLYPTEHITNGIGWNGVHEDITPIITRPDGSKEYRISDHLASLRVSLTNGSPTTYYDYDPWGNLLGVTTAPRRGFNDNEKDRENGLFSLGVRKYEEGRFISIDPLFEKEPEISPYVYAGNAPLNFTDPGGKQREKFFMRGTIAFFGLEVGMSIGAGMAGSGGVSAEPDGQSSGKFGPLGLRPSSMEHSSGVTYTKVGAVPKSIQEASTLQRSIGKTDGGPGVWTKANESMSNRAQSYQSQITGKPTGLVYLVGGVKFDGYKSGLIDAKGPGYASFVKNGRFADWFAGGASLALQAKSQIAVAGGSPITWHIAESVVVSAVNNLFKENNITGINVVHTPAKPE